MLRVLKITAGMICATMFVNVLFAASFDMYRRFQAFYIKFSEGAHGKPGREIVELLDLFLFALVFLILSLDFMKLFFPDFNAFNAITLPWFKVEDFFHLRILSWNAVLLTLLMAFGTNVLRSIRSLEWTVLIVPASALLFSLRQNFYRIEHSVMARS